MGNKYLEQFSKYSESLKDILNDKSDVFIEMSFEKLFGSNESIDYLVDWYNNRKEQCGMSIERIPLSECKGWDFDRKTGSIVHDSGEFFVIEGIRVSNSSTREVLGGWDQPIVSQVGFDGGILGLLRKRIDGVPHYLVEAKAEPGNPGIVQISTTVQATFSNLKKAHGGRATLYSEYFLEPEQNNAKVIFERWMSEDGGRLFNKRNKTMVVEVEHEVKLASENYKWVKLSHLAKLNKSTDALVAPHLRGILSVV